MSEIDEEQEYISEYSICNCLKLGDKAPDFEAVTTNGDIKFHDFARGHWVLLFSHPGDFTPVCSTEFVAFAKNQEEFDNRDVKLIGLSVDSIHSHIAWLRDLERTFDVTIDFPLIADLSAEVATLYGMIHPAISDTQTVRTVFIIDPDGIIRYMVAYPQSVGRNVHELIRTLDALMLTQKNHVATPADWKEGDSVIVPPPKTLKDSEKDRNDAEECLTWYLCKKKI